MWELSQSDTNLAGIVAEVGADPEGLIESQQGCHPHHERGLGFLYPPKMNFSLELVYFCELNKGTALLLCNASNLVLEMLKRYKIW